MPLPSPAGFRAGLQFPDIIDVDLAAGRAERLLPTS
jgi:hypothetical protein